MIPRTNRKRALAKALTLLIPGAPFSDFEAVREAASAPHLRALPVSTAAWLAAVAHVRHQWTDYHQLLDDGYDRDSARFFVINQTNAKLTEWRATRLLDPDGDEE
ncbi:MAG: DUF2293 domain-containing protein [Rhizobiaceae bacterium]